MRIIVTTALLAGMLCSASADESDTIWVRKIIQLGGATVESAELNLAAGGSVSVYFNGQRLGRGLTSGGNRLHWNVSRLARNGRNCVAIALTASAAQRSLEVWLASNEKKIPVAGWKAAPAPPPVGWQTTDFNDRDWKPGNVQGIQDAESLEVSKLDWTGKNPRNRFADGHVALKDGDHVVLLGGTFIERAQQFGHLEAALNSDPTKSITFRNLGWSGDTVYAESRGIFDSPERGYERMVEHVRAEEPTVILISYGQNESMVPAEAGAEKFRAGLKRLARDLATTGAELVFLTPHPFVRLSPPLPDATRWNRQLADSGTIIREVAADHSAAVIDLNTEFTALMSRHAVFTRHLLQPINERGETSSSPEVNALWTHNGMHWNDDGYRAASQVVALRLIGHAAPKPIITVNPGTGRVMASGCETRNEKWAKDSKELLSIEFRTASVSPYPIAVRLPVDAPIMDVRVSTHESEGVPAEALAASKVTDDDGARIEYNTFTCPAYEKLRHLTAKKNELYFHRWRPQNITYLFGFRKHEQGNNASEIARFDPLVDDLEKQIHAAKQPGWNKLILARRKK